MQDTDENKKPSSPPSPDNNERLTIRPLNEEAVREHLLETEPPVRLAPSEIPAPTSSSNPAPPSGIPAYTHPEAMPVDGQSVVDDNFEWKPKTRLSHRSKLLRFYALALMLLPLLGVVTVLWSGMLTMAAFNSTALVLSIIALGTLSLAILAGIILYTTKSKALANTIVTIFLVLSILSLIGSTLTLNIAGILTGVIALALIVAVRREVSVLA